MEGSLRHTENLTWVWVIFLIYWFLSALNYFWSKNRKFENEQKDRTVYKLLLLTIPRTFHILPLVVGLALWISHINEIPFDFWRTATILGYTFGFLLVHYLVILLLIWGMNTHLRIGIVLDFHRKSREFLALMVTSFFTIRNLIVPEWGFFEAKVLYIILTLFVGYVFYNSVRTIRVQGISILTLFLYNCTVQILPIFLWLKFMTRYLV